MNTLLIVSTLYENAQYLENLLSRVGYLSHIALTSEDVIEAVNRLGPSLLIVNADVHHHDEGCSLCAHLSCHPQTKNMPILFVATTDISVKQVAALLDSGCDDVIKAPFESSELMARLRALMRRTHMAIRRTTPSIRLDSARNAVQLEERIVFLTPTEFELFSFLCQNRSRYYRASDLLQDLWQYPPKAGDTALVRNHIRNLRLKLEADPDHPRVLTSQYGRGYMVQAHVEMG